MTINPFYASPGRRFLTCALASTLLIASTGLATASGRTTLNSHDARNASDSGRNTSGKRSSPSKRQAPVYTLANERTANTLRSNVNVSEAADKRTGNNERNPVLDTLESLSWSAPMTRENGNKLYPGEIEGYRIYYRKPGQEKFRRIEVTDGSLTSFQLKRFKSGDYEFSVTTMDTNGLESRRSPVISASL